MNINQEGTYILIIKFKPELGTETTLNQTQVIYKYSPLKLDTQLASYYEENFISIYFINDGNLSVYMDNKFVETLEITYSDYQYSPSNFNLTPGVHTLKLVFKPEDIGEEFEYNGSVAYFPMEYPYDVNTNEKINIKTETSTDVTGTLTIYKTVFNSIANEYEQDGQLGTWNINDGLVNVEIPVSHEHYNKFILEFSTNKGDFNKTIEIYVVKNEEDVNVTVTPSINFGDNVEVAFSSQIPVLLTVCVDDNHDLYYEDWNDYKYFKTINVTNLSEGNHKIRVTLYKMSSIGYDYQMYTNTFLVNVDKKQEVAPIKNPGLKIASIPNFVEGNSITIKVTGDSGFNGNVQVNINGVNYTVNLVNGVGTKTIKPNLKPGTYKATVIFNGNSTYSAVNIQSNNFKVTAKPIPKKVTTISASKKTFKKSVKVKKYIVTLKSGKTVLKNSKVTLTVKKKTYTATTNKKGQATFKITNLKKKGTYKATIKYAGSKTYKASNKTVKIIIK